MQALVKVDRGVGHVELRDMPEPAVGPGHVVIEVASCGVCGTDLHIMADEYSSNPPVILGHEFSGVVAGVGLEVSGFRLGDRVVSTPYFKVCGTCRHCRTGRWNQCPARVSVGSGTHGGFARYVLMPDRGLFHVPEHVDLQAAALTEPLACCVHAILEETQVVPGDLVLVLGPGPIGLLALQVARAAGARTVVCGTREDAARLALAQALGADQVLDGQQTDVPAFVRELTGGEGADVVLECSGAAPAVLTGLQALRRRGQFTQIGLFGKMLQVDFDQVVYKEVQLHGSFASTWTAWKKALELIGQGRIQLAPLISDVLPLSQWEVGVDKFRKKDGLKVLLLPGEATGAISSEGKELTEATGCRTN